MGNNYTKWHFIHIANALGNAVVASQSAEGTMKRLDKLTIEQKLRAFDFFIERLIGEFTINNDLFDENRFRDRAMLPLVEKDSTEENENV